MNADYDPSATVLSGRDVSLPDRVARVTST